jgi:hypothetical protein
MYCNYKATLCSHCILSLMQIYTAYIHNMETELSKNTRKKAKAVHLPPSGATLDLYQLRVK